MGLTSTQPKRMKKERFMKPVEREYRLRPSSLYRRLLKSSTAYLLVLATVMLLLPLPAKATWTDKSCQLPGIVNAQCTNYTPIIVVAAVGTAAAVVLFVYAKKHHKGNTAVKLDLKPVKFEDFTPGQPAKLSVPLKDMMSAPITVKEVAVDDPTGAVTLGDARQGTFTLAPGEVYDIPVTLSTTNSEGKARIRIVATSQKANKDIVQFIKVSYGKGAAKHLGLFHK